MVTIADWLVALGTVVMALGTLLLAGIAIFQDEIRDWRKHPELNVSIYPQPPDCHKTMLRANTEFFTSFVATGEMTEPVLTDIYYLRLRVSNLGKQTAQSVEVFAVELSKRQADGEFKPVNSFPSMNLCWSYSRTILFPAIAPDTYKHCDLAHVIDPNWRVRIPVENNSWPNVPPAKAVLSFDTAVQPYNLSHLMPFGTYRLAIIVAAANAKPIKKTLEITVTGDWYEDEQKMLTEGIGIRLL